jgi:hypothetical protein
VHPSAPRILICTPYRASTHPLLVERWERHAQALIAKQSGVKALLHGDTSAPQHSDGRYSAHARARNALLDAIDLGAYDYLYWVDVDIICWPDGLLDWALKHNPDGVSAPAVTLHRYVDRFYDIWGFLEGGQPTRPYPPWFDGAGPIVELDSVGCCYVIPAQIYRDGARYRDTPGTATEHLSVMQACREQGRRIIANLDLRAVHAYLPEYGMESL